MLVFLAQRPLCGLQNTDIQCLPAFGTCQCDLSSQPWLFFAIWKTLYMSSKSAKPVVLLITQSQQSARSISKILDASFSVIVAADAEFAWDQLIENQQIQVLICELSLAIDDYNLLGRIRNANENRLAASPVLLLVGERDSDHDRESAFRLGATDFINMPFVSSELITRTRLHAQIYQQHAEGLAINAESLSAANVLHNLAQESIFRSRMEQELAFSSRHKTFVSVCKLKIDNMKAMIASFEKSGAMSVVQSVAIVLRKSLRREDTLSYLGKAEFCILYPATNGIGAAAAVSRFVKQIASSKIQLAGKRVPVSLSVAIYTDVANKNVDADSVLSVLQSRLMQAVAQGGNRIISSPHESEKTQLSIDAALRLIEQNNTDTLQPRARELLREVLPLLDYSDSVLNLGLASLSQDIRERLK